MHLQAPWPSWSYVCAVMEILMSVGKASPFAPPDRESWSSRSKPTPADSGQRQALSDAELDQIWAGAHGDPHFFDIIIPLDPDASIPVGATQMPSSFVDAMTNNRGKAAVEYDAQGRTFSVGGGTSRQP